MADNRLKIKAVTVGDTAVGKTCVLIAYAKGEFPVEYVPTVFETYETTVEVNNVPILFELWDTAGSEQLDVIRPMSYSDADVFIVVYSVVDKESLEHVENKWVPDIKDKGDPDVPFILVGNKVDLRKASKSYVTFDEVQDAKNRVGATAAFEVSAKMKQGLKEAFDEVIKIAVIRKQELASKKKADKGKKKRGKRQCVIL